jgi:3-oxoadipate enol-lactonase
MAGANDPICSPTCTQWMSERIPGARTIMFEGCSHFFLMEDRDRFAAALNHFLAEQDGTAR